MNHIITATALFAIGICRHQFRILDTNDPNSPIPSDRNVGQAHDAPRFTHHAPRTTHYALRATIEEPRT